ncbi:MAG: cob(I)yrinic acid a,c-diamide adenosyltransferase [Desulfobulbaceae bacterium]|nr:cob(I)yrinic acid a,c-diamide adenosyltransferase [Desulfobulbaceae bacterium]
MASYSTRKRVSVMFEEKQREKGLLLVFTGNGKGKTTAALGLAFRAIGHDFPVCMIQFVKGSWKYGEIEAAKHFDNLMELHVLGRGFTWKSDDLTKDIKAARDAWEFAARIIGENRHRLVILDELTYLISYSILQEQEVLDVLARRPENMHIAVTGRNATEGLIDAADLVTEMRNVKHAYDNGIRAQKGIEF